MNIWIVSMDRLQLRFKRDLGPIARIIWPGRMETPQNQDDTVSLYSFALRARPPFAFGCWNMLVCWSLWTSVLDWEDIPRGNDSWIQSANAQIFAGFWKLRMVGCLMLPSRSGWTNIFFQWWELSCDSENCLYAMNWTTKKKRRWLEAD